MCVKPWGAVGSGWGQEVAGVLTSAPNQQVLLTQALHVGKWGRACPVTIGQYQSHVKERPSHPAKGIWGPSKKLNTQEKLSPEYKKTAKSRCMKM